MDVVQYKTKAMLQQSEADDELIFSQWSDPAFRITNFGRTVGIFRDKRIGLKAVTNRPLKPGETFRIVALGVNLEVKYQYFEVGLTSSKRYDGNGGNNCWLCVFHDRVDIIGQRSIGGGLYPENISKLKVGNVYCIRLNTNGVATFFINGYEVRRALPQNIKDLYGYCDISALITEVSTSNI